MAINHAGICVVMVAVSDRKSTRLNSSHLGISYAVFCLKKKDGLVVGEQPPNRAVVYELRRGARPRVISGCARRDRDRVPGPHLRSVFFLKNRGPRGFPLLPLRGVFRV